MSDAPGDEPAADERPPRNWLPAPLRSEDAAFRTVLWTAAAAVALAVVVVIVRALT